MKEVSEVQLEESIVNWYKTKFPELRQQFESSKVKKREYSGAGFFIYYLSKSDNKPVVFNLSSKSLNGPNIESSDLEYGGGSLLFFEDGIVKMIELFSYGDIFPQKLTNYTLVDIKLENEFKPVHVKC